MLLAVFSSVARQTDPGIEIRKDHGVIVTAHCDVEVVSLALQIEGVPNADKARPLMQFGIADFPEAIDNFLMSKGSSRAQFPGLDLHWMRGDDAGLYLRYSNCGDQRFPEAGKYLLVAVPKTDSILDPVKADYCGNILVQSDHGGQISCLVSDNHITEQSHGMNARAIMPLGVQEAVPADGTCRVNVKGFLTLHHKRPEDFDGYNLSLVPGTTVGLKELVISRSNGGRKTKDKTGLYVLLAVPASEQKPAWV